MCSGTTVLQHANELLVEQHRICLAPTYDHAMTSPVWTVQPGDTLVREQIHGAYGGNPQAGISRSSSTPNVLVYSDHDKAAANGYDFDGWDQSQHAYYYTGEGKVGDQLMLRGNRAIAEHQSDGTALRLFVAVATGPAQALAPTNTSASSPSTQICLTSFAGHLAPTVCRAMCLCLGCCQLVPWPLAKVPISARLRVPSRQLPLPRSPLTPYPSPQSTSSSQKWKRLSAALSSRMKLS